MSEAKVNSHCGGSQISRCFKHVPNFKELSFMAVDTTVGTNPRAKEESLVDKTGRKAEHENHFFTCSLSLCNLP